jgi:hypothetical protein
MEDPAGLVVGSRMSNRKALGLMDSCGAVALGAAAGPHRNFTCAAPRGADAVGEHVAVSAPGASVCGLLLCVRELLFRRGAARARAAATPARPRRGARGLVERATPGAFKRGAGAPALRQPRQTSRTATPACVVARRARISRPSERGSPLSRKAAKLYDLYLAAQGNQMAPPTAPDGTCLGFPSPTYRTCPAGKACTSVYEPGGMACRCAGRHGFARRRTAGLLAADAPPPLFRTAPPSAQPRPRAAAANARPSLTYVLATRVSARRTQGHKPLAAGGGRAHAARRGACTPSACPRGAELPEIPAPSLPPPFHPARRHYDRHSELLLHMPRPAGVRDVRGPVESRAPGLGADRPTAAFRHSGPRAPRSKPGNE